ncbi:hypothetical protein FKR81_30355 [Lentzea tibetensis]|uniref:Streptogrisin C n=1 Tax=Lentzea tibetensis TaxID=2591470 RepID=A0A563ELR3_9PSEU|nr:hypothetical protein [Lentzea tibetensis]TWP47972.1 hypothetical protein FKR81_30355 [Lentzea tibetensis]
MNVKRLRRAAIFAACAVLALVPMTPSATAATREPAAPPPTGSVAATPAGFASWADVFAVQDELNAAARHIVAARDSEYAGVVADPANGDLRVYWKGDVPRSVRRIADGLGVPVVFLPARFSEREMLAEARRLTTDPRVLSVGPEADGSGLTIAVTEAGARELRVGATGVLGTTTMALHLQSGPAPQPLSRQNDYSPRLGGSKYRIGRGECTTGFSITWNREARMLTAGHCGNNTNVAYDGGGDLIGDVFNDVPGRDTMMINTRVQGETFGPSIYIGPWDGNVARNVASAEADFVGNYVCTGGARTGEHCGVRVTHVNQTDEGFFPLIRGELDGAGCAAARGDSGGPVYQPRRGTLDMFGRGTISTGRPGTGTSCPNAPPSDSSRIVYWAPLLRPPGDATVGSLQFYGATLL